MAEPQKVEWPQLREQRGVEVLLEAFDQERNTQNQTSPARLGSVSRVGEVFEKKGGKGEEKEKRIRYRTPKIHSKSLIMICIMEEAWGVSSIAKAAVSCSERSRFGAKTVARLVEVILLMLE